MPLKYAVSIVLGLISLAGVLGTPLLPRLLPSVRNHGDRALALQEVELLTKLDPGTSAAKQLSAIIQRRIEGWHAKMFPPAPKDHLAKAVRESFKPYDGPVPRWVRVVQVVMVLFFGSLLALIIWGAITSPSGGNNPQSCGLLLLPC